MEYLNNKKILKGFYDQLGLASKFDRDNVYLENAFNDINKIWIDNLNDIKSVNFVMIAEAPLWGLKKKYIYNQELNNSQFFYRSDLGDILNIHIPDKKRFLKILIDIGFVIVDISPFALNSHDTEVNYRDLTNNLYRQLVSWTIPFFFEEKIKAIKSKKSKNCKTFFRYLRVKDTFEDLIVDLLIKNQIVNSKDELSDISQSGGGIDKKKLREILGSIDI